MDILKQFCLFFEMEVNSDKTFTSAFRASVKILPLFTSISKNNCSIVATLLAADFEGDGSPLDAFTCLDNDGGGTVEKKLIPEVKGNTRLSNGCH